MHPRDPLSVHPFDRDALKRFLGTGPAVEYLAEYLSALGASALIVEPYYVDRHYLDDFVRYYSRSFQAPAPKCSRLHFFCRLTTDELDGLLDAAVQSGRERTTSQEHLGPHYLGFVVRRPLQGPAMGRTVLRTYPVDERRHYTVVRPYRAHLAGMQLRVDGLAYQQQDGGAAVCASTALWSALQRSAHMAGHRTPTPSQITAAARSPYPASHGLNHMQMAEALSALGYIADEFPAGTNVALFRSQLVCCLDSQLPVVLLLERDGGQAPEGHAVTITGYSEPRAGADVTVPGADQPLRLRGAGVEVLYVHDDNLGSHAHYELFERKVAPLHRLMLRRGRSVDGARPWWTPDEWTIAGALVPKPDKIRLPIEGLFSVVLTLRALVEELLLPGIEVDYTPRFRSGIEYVSDAIAMPLNSIERAGFFRSLSLPRHVGVVSVCGLDRHLLDIVLDATSVANGPTLEPLLGLVAPGIPHDSAAGRVLKVLAKQLGLPSISGL